MGTIVMGKLESGRVEKGQTILMMPNKASVEVMQIWLDEDEVRCLFICFSVFPFVPVSVVVQ